MTSYPESVNTNARVKVSVGGVEKGKRRAINFTSDDSSVTITGTDDGTNEKVTVDFSVAGGGGTSTDRLSASVSSITVSAGGGDVDWTSASTTDSQGSSFDLLGSSLDEAKPTLEVLHDGLYAITARFNCSNPQNATYVAYTLFATPSNLAFAPSTDGGSIPQIQEFANLALTYWMAAGTVVTFYADNDATSPITVSAAVAAQRIA